MGVLPGKKKKRYPYQMNWNKQWKSPLFLIFPELDYPAKLKPLHRISFSGSPLLKAEETSPGGGGGRVGATAAEDR